MPDGRISAEVYANRDGRWSRTGLPPVGLSSALRNGPRFSSALNTRSTVPRASLSQRALSRTFARAVAARPVNLSTIHFATLTTMLEVSNDRFPTTSSAVGPLAARVNSCRNVKLKFGGHDGVVARPWIVITILPLRRSKVTVLSAIVHVAMPIETGSIEVVSILSIVG